VEALLKVEGLTKVYTRGFVRKRPTFGLKADFTIDGAAIVGVMGPNGSGKTTLFELLSGSNVPTSGRVICKGQDVHRVKYRERNKLVVHYHQSYQVRRVKRTKPSFLLESARFDSPLVQVFDEPQFSTQDSYIGFMLRFFHQLRKKGRLVMLCLHPNEPFQVDIMRKNCERFLFVSKGEVADLPTYDRLLAHPGVREYLGALADC
jgi:ABC-type multidrug transport system ATPase subunit